MVDNYVTNTASSTGATFAADDIGGILFPRIKLVQGADGANDGDISSANPLSVTVANTAVPVTGTFWQATQPVSGTFWQATQPVSIAATVTVDTELPTAVAIGGTGIASPTTPIVGAGMLIYNGTTWDAVQTGASDGSTSAQKVPAIQWLFNGSTFDRVRTVVAGQDTTGTGIPASGLLAQFDDVSPSTVTENRFAPVRMSSRRNLYAEAQAATLGGATPYSYICTAGTNQDSQNVKSSAGQVYGYDLFNVSANPRYVKVYDKASAPTSTDTPKMRLILPGNTSGAGAVRSIDVGLEFTAGIGFRVTTGQADSDTTAVTSGDVVVNLQYK